MKRNTAYKIVSALKDIRANLTDEVALNYIDVYPVWKNNIGKELVLGDRVVYNDKLYKVTTTHVTQTDWAPDVALTLFEPIDLVNKGTLTNPIIAARGMTYFKDKYYLDETNNSIYLCTRDDSNGNGIILQFIPSELVGVYFTLVE